MLATTYSQSLLGLDGVLVEVEAHVARGVPAFNVVGLGDKAVQEARERVRSGIASAELEFPLRRVTVNLAPGAIRKAGPRHDLAIAVAILAATGQVRPERAARVSCIGELALDARLRPVPGALLAAETSRAAGFEALLCPAASAAEAALVSDIDVIGVEHLAEAVAWLRGEVVDRARAARAPPRVNGRWKADLARRPRPAARPPRARAGRRGRSQHACSSARRARGRRCSPAACRACCPTSTSAQSLEVTRIHSAAGLLPPASGAIVRPPFRAPHHSASPAAIVGGGPRPGPGELTLATAACCSSTSSPSFRAT